MGLYYGPNTTIDLPRRCSRQWLTAIHGRGWCDRRILESARVAAIQRESSRRIHGETDSRQCHIRVLDILRNAWCGDAARIVGHQNSKTECSMVFPALDVINADA